MERGPGHNKVGRSMVLPPRRAHPAADMAQGSICLLRSTSFDVCLLRPVGQKRAAAFNILVGPWQVSEVGGCRVESHTLIYNHLEYLPFFCPLQVPHTIPYTSLRPPIASTLARHTKSTSLSSSPCSRHQTTQPNQPTHPSPPLLIPDEMAGSSPYGPVVVHQTKDGRAGDSGSVTSMATRSSTSRSRQGSADSDASSAASTTWSSQHGSKPPRCRRPVLVLLSSSARMPSMLY